MSAQDMRDMMGLTGDMPRPMKKRKIVEKRPAEKGMAREVSALMGERAPPVSMIQVQPKYKQRPRRTQKATPWVWTPFTNDARKDNMTLYHWQRKQPLRPDQDKPTKAEDEADTIKTEKEKDKPYQFAKYDIQIDVPSYSDDMYEASLKDSDWTKEETDYLVELVSDYGQKWPIVWDRYEYTPTKLEDAEEPSEAKHRTMEDLKARYYMVRAKVLAHETPVASMNGTQYSLYQTLTHFDVKQESCRKKMTEQHLYRTEMEVQEETTLLAELQRIMINQSQLEASRKEIRDRLDFPASGASTTQYTTSAALGQLFQQLLAADRSKKDRRLKDLPHVQTSGHHGAGSHRDSLSGLAGNKSRGPRDSLASAVSLADTAGGPGTPHARSAAAAAATTGRALSPHSRDRFFVSVHERLGGGGVSFASDKLAKPRAAKSAVQTERIAAVLQVLKVPDIIPVPTQAVVESFDALMAKVHVLLEMRKVGEREEAEIKTRAAEKGITQGGEKGDAGGATPAALAATADEGRGVKRSASVLSDSSQAREKRRK